MRFFEHQAQARAKTTRLVVLYGLGVLFVGLLSGLAIHFALSFDGSTLDNMSEAHFSLVATGAIGTWGVVLLGSAIRTMRLGQGGRVVAESLGGTLLNHQTADLAEKRALNVVEEMALASGMPVPPVYLLRRETSINAFAAGWSPDDAVIGLTRGAVEHLSRSELQGVVAHEFSHILNRDSALNMRMLGVLHGIVALSLVGRFLMTVRSSNRKRDAAPFAMIGIALWLLGSVGAFIAELIQAAVSREREFLADASAVQFTRDPTGIAGALAKIGLVSSYLGSSAARPANHLLIAEASPPGFFDRASHPPLKERIRRLVPSWNGEFTSLCSPLGATSLGSLGGGSFGLASGAMGFSGATHAQGGSADLRDASDEPNLSPFQGTQRHMIDGAREPYFARLLLLAASLDENLEARNAQLANLELADPSIAGLLPSIHQNYLAVPPGERLPLIDLALGTLAALSRRQADELYLLLEQARAGLSPFAHRAFAVLRLGQRHLVPPGQLQQRTHGSPSDRAEAIACLLGVLARRGQKSETQAASAFAHGKSRLAHLVPELAFPAPRALTLDALDRALLTLLEAPLSERRSVLDALESVASFDGVLKPLESELIHTFAVCLNVATRTRLIETEPGAVT